MLGDVPDLIENLALLTQRPNDTWDGYYSPIRFEAGLALFQIGTAQAWEVLVAASLTSPGNFLDGFLLDWIAILTDKLSGIANADNVYGEGILGVQRRWFKALLD